MSFLSLIFIYDVLFAFSLKKLGYDIILMAGAGALGAAFAFALGAPTETSSSTEKLFVATPAQLTFSNLTTTGYRSYPPLPMVATVPHSWNQYDSGRITLTVEPLYTSFIMTQALPPLVGVGATDAAAATDVDLLLFKIQVATF